MNQALRKKYLFDSLILLIACSLFILLFCWFRVWIVGELDTRQFRQIIDLLPNDWRKMSPVDFDWLVSYLGRTALTLDEPLLMMFVCGWAIVRGSDVVSGEISRGTMEMLLAQPVSRRQIFWTHARWTVIFLLLLVLITWAGMTLGIWSTSVEESSYPEFRVPLVGYKIPLTFLAPQTETVAMATEVSPLQFLPGLLNLFCMGFFLAGFSAWCSASDRYRWRTLGIIVGFYMLSAMLKLGGMASESFSWMAHLSFFSLYEPAQSIELVEHNLNAIAWLFKYKDGAVVGLGPLAANLVFLAAGCMFYLLGMRTFDRRDLPAPL